VEDASQIVRVRVVEVHGRAPRDAVVEHQGVKTRLPALPHLIDPVERA
jgi:hypothetical protein